MTSIAIAQGFHAFLLGLLIWITVRTRTRLGHRHAWLLIVIAFSLEILRAGLEGFNLAAWQSSRLTLCLRWIEPIWAMLLAVGVGIHLHGRGILKEVFDVGKAV